MIDRDIYFDSVRDSLFSGALEQVHVDGQSVILAVWDYQAGGTPMTDLRWLAYMLATTYHETAQRMWPVTEYGSQSYLQGKEYWPYIGRGFVQLTWEDNYDNASKALALIDERDLVEHPEMALDSVSSPPASCSGAWPKAGSPTASSASISMTSGTIRSTPARSSTAMTRTR